MIRRLPQRPLALVTAIGLALTLAACSPMGPARTSAVPQVDPQRYLGTWYEQGSIKQFFSFGLVNTSANYSLNADGSVRVENRGEYFSDGGAESKIVGNAAFVDDTFAKLNVTFVGNATRTPPGNYWIVDLDPDYRWAIVSDQSGLSGFILTRDKQVGEALYQDLLARAQAAGVVTTNFSRTPQF